MTVKEQDDADDFWPLWEEPATKGDVISAMVAVRACTIDTFLCLSALARQDNDAFLKRLKELDKSDEKLSELIDKIGGGGLDRG